MPKPTERAVKRKPLAVIMLTANRADATTTEVKVPPEGYDFEWFQTKANMAKFFDQVHGFNEKDAKDHNDFCYLTVEVTDTADMTLGRVEVAPRNREMTAWKNRVKKDPSLLLTAPAAKKDGEAKKAVVKPRKKSGDAASSEVKKGAQGATEAPKPRAQRAKPTAKKATATKTAAPTAKAADLRKKLAQKKGTTQAEAEVAALDAALKEG